MGEAAGAGRHAPELVSRGGFSATGPHRARNEDAFSLAPGGPGEARYGTLCALADGVGSRPGGDTASRDAVYYLQALYYAAAGPPAPGERLRRAVEAVNWLGRAAAAGGAEALTTLVAAAIMGERVWIANVGDSRAYLVRARSGECRRLTEDHSQDVPLEGQAGVSAASAGPPAESAAGEGATVPSKPAPAPRPLVTRAITRAIGLEPTSQMDLYTYAWEPGDRLVLCSDGLAALPPAQIAQVVLGAVPATAARQLVAEALRVDGTDNATAVVLGWEPAPEAERPESPAASLARAPAARERAGAGTLSLGVVIALAAAALGVGLALGWLSAAAFMAWGA